MNFRAAYGHVGFHLSTVHPQMARDNRKRYRMRFPFCSVYPVHRQCVLLVIGQVLLVYLQWGDGLGYLGARK
ncbi:MAG: hypothetical protein OK454_11900 [Thaumarchaeota archaeon]|nr:hypothetical protein [Nitrososphaerota archaeon]